MPVLALSLENKLMNKLRLCPSETHGTSGEKRWENKLDIMWNVKRELEDIKPTFQSMIRVHIHLKYFSPFPRLMR